MPPGADPENSLIMMARGVAGLPASIRTGGTPVRLNYQITVSFLPFLIFIFVVLGMAQLAVSYDSAMSSSQKHLETAAVLQGNRIMLAMQMQRSLLGALSSRTKMRRSLRTWVDQGEEEARASVQQILGDAASGTPDLRGVIVLDPASHIVASTDGSPVGEVYRPKDWINDFGLDGDLTNLEGDRRIALFHRDDAGVIQQTLLGKIHLEGRHVGYMVAEVTPTFLHDMELDYAGMGETGEFVLAQRNRDQRAEILSPLRFPGESSGGGLILPPSGLLPMNRALAGRESFLPTAPDYRNEPVLAVTRHLPEYGLGLVAKIDRSEALAPLARNAWITGLVLIVALVVTTWICRWLARSISVPLEKLTHDAEAMLKSRGIEPARHNFATHEVGVLQDMLKQLEKRLYEATQERHEQELLERHRPARGDTGTPDETQYTASR